MTHRIVGWSGTSVKDGAGIKSALLQDPSSQRFANATHPLVWRDRVEIDALEQRGLLTRRDLNADAVDDGVVLYAALQFISPYESDRLVLSPEQMVLHPVRSSLIWVGYMPRPNAVGILREWGKRLIEDAKARLSRRSSGSSRTIDTERTLDAERALDDARRARFCISPRDERALRYDLFLVMAVASQRLDQPVEAIYLDAGIDLSLAEVDALKRDVDAFDRRTANASGHRVMDSTDLPVPPFGRPGYAPRLSIPPSV